MKCDMISHAMRMSCDFGGKMEGGMIKLKREIPPVA